MDGEEYWKKKKKMLYKKVLAKLANAGTVALLGYEAGTHFAENSGEEKVEHKSEVTNNSSDIIIICGIIMLIGILIAIFARLFYINRPRSLV